MDSKDSEKKNENTQRNAEMQAKQQERLKKQAKQSDHEEEIKAADPKQLRRKLSNKNSDYIFRLEKFLAEGENYSMEQVEPMIDQILPEIIIAQQKGIPASTLYQKSPSEKAHDLAHPKEKPVKQNFWLQVLDSSLLYLALFTGLLGVVQLFSGNRVQGGELGVFTMIVLVFVLGWMMAYYSRWMVTPKDQRIPTWQIIVYGFGIILLLFVWVTGTSLPALRTINPPLNAWVDIVIAVIAVGLRYYLKRKYHIVDPVREARLQEAKKRD